MRRPQAFKETRIALMQRISKSRGFAERQQTSVQSAISVFEKKKHDLRGFHSTTDPTDLTASLGGRYCLPDSSPFIIGNPETTSRVTLASLGIVFQTNHVLLFGCLVVLLFVIFACGLTINQTTKPQNN